VSCGAGCRRGPDPELPWPWCGLAATAPIRPLAWELPDAVGTPLKKKKRFLFAALKGSVWLQGVACAERQGASTLRKGRVRKNKER